MRSFPRWSGLFPFLSRLSSPSSTQHPPPSIGTPLRTKLEPRQPASHNHADLTVSAVIQAPRSHTHTHQTSIDFPLRTAA